MVQKADSNVGGGPPSNPVITYASTTRGYTAQATANRVQSKKAARQTRTIKDSSGTTLIQNDASGFGLKRPYLEWGAYPTSQESTPPASTSSGSFTSLWTVASEPQHPIVRVRVRAVTGAATAGEVKLVDRATGITLTGTGVLVVGTATTVEANIDGILVNPTLSGSGAPMKVDLEARITAGAATIAVLVIYVVGIGS